MPNLLHEAERLAAVTDAVSAAYARELARVLRDLERDLRRLAIAAQDGSQSALMRALTAGKARAQIRTALEDAGYHALVRWASDTGLDAVVEQVGKLRAAAGLAPFLTADASRIVALKRLAQIDLFGQGDEIAHAVWRTLAQGIFTQRSVSDLMDDLADAIDVEVRQARTLYDTSVSVFGRQLETMKATGEADEPFAYLGPLDQKTRDWCADRVGKVFTRSEIEQMDNGQLPNVMLTGGGYNCRHQFTAVSRYGEAAGMVGTGQRLPEYERIAVGSAA